jgi:release factor glutamine methyltransferase
MTIHDAKQQLVFQLFHLYDEREATLIADWVMEKLTGWKKIDRVVNKTVALSAEQENLLDKYTRELLDYRPVQYVLQEAWFYGLRLYVDENVLIPRPETEELVDWIVQDTRYRIQDTGLAASGILYPASGIGHPESVRVLDVGTGSGCIAIAIKHTLPISEVWACDTSDTALNVARLNADVLHAQIDFVPLDFLDITQQHQLPKVDIIVSNPPYVPLKDKAAMLPHVLQYEPHLALFVTDNDPLIFYNAIASFAKEHLHANGTVYVEIHELLGNEVVQLFRQHGFTEIVLKKDLQGRDRMVKAAL